MANRLKIPSPLMPHIVKMDFEDLQHTIEITADGIGTNETKT